MAKRTFYELAQEIAVKARLNIPSQIFGSIDEDAVLIKTCLKEGALIDVMRADNWEVLRKRHTGDYDDDLLSGASDYMAFDLPSDFDRIVNNTVWELNDMKRMVGPLTIDEWEAHLSGLVATAAVTKVYTIKRYTEGADETKKVFCVYPTTTSGGTEDFSFQYISTQYVYDSTKNMKDAYDADGDYTVLDDEVVKLAGLIRVLKVLGMDYGEEMNEFNAARKERIGRDGGAPRLRMDDGGDFRLVWNLPETGYGS
jgi:hypothetical protein